MKTKCQNKPTMDTEKEYRKNSFRKSRNKRWTKKTESKPHVTQKIPFPRALKVILPLRSNGLVSPNGPIKTLTMLHKHRWAVRCMRTV